MKKDLKNRKIINVIAFVVAFIIITAQCVANAASDNVNLKELSVNPHASELSQYNENSNSKYYRVTVSKNVTSVEITAVPEDSSTKIEVSGNTDLQVGNNKVAIVATAKSGKTFNYVIYVRRLSEEIAETEIVPNVPETDINVETNTEENNTVINNDIVNTENNQLNEVNGINDVSELIENNEMIGANTRTNKVNVGAIIIIIIAVATIVLISVLIVKKGKNRKH